MQISDPFTPLVRGLAAGHFQLCRHQFLLLQRTHGAEHPDVVKARTELDQAIALCRELDPSFEIPVAA